MPWRDPITAAEVSLMMREQPLSPAAAPARPAPPAARLTMPSFTTLETSALVLAGFTLVLLYVALMDIARQSGADDSQILMLLPHVALLALIVAGLRRLATILMTFILIAACLVGLVACLNALTRSHDSRGLGFAAALQLPLFILVLRIGRMPFSLSELAAKGSRLALGAIVGVAGWYASDLAVQQAAAPQRARLAVIEATRRRDLARTDARAQVGAITACLQRVPVTPDSQPDFPVALSALPPRECPEAAQPAPGGFVLEYTAGAADADGHRRRFKLAAHEDSIAESARTYESDEHMVLREWYGRDVRSRVNTSANPIGQLTEIGRCIEEGRSAADAAGRVTYAASLAALVGKGHCYFTRLSADSSAMLVEANGGRSLVRYVAPRGPRPADAPGGYALSLEAERDSLGRSAGGPRLSFQVDTTGAIHMTRRGRAATAADSTVPDCPAIRSGCKCRWTKSAASGFPASGGECNPSCRRSAGAGPGAAASARVIRCS